ncbi:hypothetical protein [Streptosporangium sp. NPDC000396]|uniref:hypothetical protein n=1 Tax=Streptosporangium sp. NPDC000396 TaxID=3366185 RepID=UPI003681780A
MGHRDHPAQPHRRGEVTQFGQPVTGLEAIGNLHLFGEPVGADAVSRFYDPAGNTFDYVYELTGDKPTIWGGAKGSPAYGVLRGQPGVLRGQVQRRRHHDHRRVGLPRRGRMRIDHDPDLTSAHNADLNGWEAVSLSEQGGRRSLVELLPGRFGLMLRTRGRRRIHGQNEGGPSKPARADLNASLAGLPEGATLTYHSSDREPEERFHEMFSTLPETLKVPARSSVGRWV